MPQKKNKKKKKRREESRDNNTPAPAGKRTVGEVIESLQPDILHKLKNDSNK